MCQRVVLVALVLAGCSSEPTPAVGGLAGTFYGDFTLGHDDPSRSVFASSQLVVDANGDIGASTFTTKAPTDVIGEVATTTGMIEMLGGTGIDITLEVEFPTLGTFTASGNGMYFDGTGDLAAQLITRDSTGAVIGQTVLSLKKDR